MYRHCAFYIMREPIWNIVNISAVAGYQNPVDKCLVLISATSGRKHVGLWERKKKKKRGCFCVWVGVGVVYINLEINANIHNNMSAFEKGWSNTKI